MLRCASCVPLVHCQLDVKGDKLRKTAKTIGFTKSLSTSAVSYYLHALSFQAKHASFKRRGFVSVHFNILDGMSSNLEFISREETKSVKSGRTFTSHA